MRADPVAHPNDRRAVTVFAGSFPSAADSHADSHGGQTQSGNVDRMNERPTTGLRDASLSDAMDVAR